MTIENLEAYVDSLPDWAILDGCFGNTMIKPSDIDGVIERNGNCLFLEHKRRGVPLKEGQRRLFQALARQGNTVIVYWESDDVITRIVLMTCNGVETRGPAESSLEILRSIVEWWFAHA